MTFDPTAIAAWRRSRAERQRRRREGEGVAADERGSAALDSTGSQHLMETQSILALVVNT